MSWDEKLFGWMWRRGRGWLAPRDTPELLARRAHFDAMSDRLAAIAIAVAGRPVTLRRAEAEGGLAGEILLLPAWIDFAASAEENEQAYVLRTALAASIVRLGLAPRGEMLSASEQTIATVIAMSTARAWLESELMASHEALRTSSETLLRARSATDTSPLERLVRAGLGEAVSEGSLEAGVLAARPASADALVTLARGFARELGSAPRPSAVPLWGWLSPRDASLAIDAPGRNPSALPSGTERTMRTRDHVEKKKLDPRENAENPLVHSFEKLHTLEEHGGGKKRVDGSDELEAHADALEELDLREVVRSDEETRSLLRSDAMFESGAGDLAGDTSEGGLPYDEWDEAKRRFRPAWCRVRVVPVEERMPIASAERSVARRTVQVRPQIDAVHRELARLELARRPRNRQLDGPEVDDDAMVDRHAALAAGTTPPDRLFRSARRHSPDLAVLLLVDASLSTDGWIEGQRVLDVERDAILVLAEALDGSIDELGVAAFSSHTRLDCRFLIVKGMNEPWARARHRMSNLQPAGYTRIGPALRHGTRVLERTAARRKLLLTITDGKPNDYDRYEGRYGVADVAHAVMEASVRGVHVHALALDREARHHLPRMFGAGGFSLLRAPGELAPAMGRAVLAMQR